MVKKEKKDKGKQSSFNWKIVTENYKPPEFLCHDYDYGRVLHPSVPPDDQAPSVLKVFTAVNNFDTQ